MVNTTQIFKFDRYRGSQKMAQGAIVQKAKTKEEALVIAKQLFDNDSGERFVLVEVAEDKYLKSNRQKNDRFR